MLVVIYCKSNFLCQRCTTHQEYAGNLSYLFFHKAPLRVFLGGCRDDSCQAAPLCASSSYATLSSTLPHLGRHSLYATHDGYLLSANRLRGVHSTHRIKTESSHVKSRLGVHMHASKHNSKPATVNSTTNTTLFTTNTNAHTHIKTHLEPEW